MTYQVFCKSRGGGGARSQLRVREGFREEAVKDGQDWDQQRWRKGRRGR